MTWTMLFISPHPPETYQNKNKSIFKRSELLLIKAEQAQATKNLCIFPKKRLFKYRKKIILKQLKPQLFYTDQNNGLLQKCKGCQECHPLVHRAHSLQVHHWNKGIGLQVNNKALTKSPPQIQALILFMHYKLEWWFLKEGITLRKEFHVHLYRSF